MSQAKPFASQADLQDKHVSFTQLSPHAWAYTAEGDPNTGVIVGDDAVMVIDTQATPVMAQDVIRRIRSVTDKPIQSVVLSHYHAVRVFGASAYVAEGAKQIIASHATYGLIVERGEADKASEIGRFPRLFRHAESIAPGLTWPTMTFTAEMTIWLGKTQVKLRQIGRGHTKGDIIVSLDDEKVCFAGDLVESHSAAYSGDAYFRDWPTTLDRLADYGFTALVPGRGAALQGEASVRQGIQSTRAFVSDIYNRVATGVAAGETLGNIYRATVQQLRPIYGHWAIFDHCMPFNVSRAFDEASGIEHPRIWTAERDRELWASLEG